MPVFLVFRQRKQRVGLYPDTMFALQIDLLIDLVIDSLLEVFKGLIIIREIVADIIATGTVDCSAPYNKGFRCFRMMSDHIGYSVDVVFRNDPVSFVCFLVEIHHVEIVDHAESLNCLRRDVMCLTVFQILLQS